MVRPTEKIRLAMQGNEKYKNEMKESLSFEIYVRAKHILKQRTRESRIAELNKVQDGIRHDVKKLVEKLYKSKVSCRISGVN